MFSFFDQIFPFTLVLKVILIIVLGLVTILGAYIIPKGKFIVIVGGIIAILVVWFIDLEISL